MLIRSCLTLVAGLLLAQCSSTLEIATENISPISYQSYTCPELARAAQDLSLKAWDLTPEQGQKWSSVKSFFGFRTENPVLGLSSSKANLKLLSKLEVTRSVRGHPARLGSGRLASSSNQPPNHPRWPNWIAGKPRGDGREPSGCVIDNSSGCYFCPGGLCRECAPGLP